MIAKRSQRISWKRISEGQIEAYDMSWFETKFIWEELQNVW